MSEYEKYSKRRKTSQRSSLPTVYEFDKLPTEFRFQAWWAIAEVIGEYKNRVGGISSTSARSSRPPEPLANRVWDQIELRVIEERGRAPLDSAYSPDERFRNYLEKEEDPERVLDAIEIALRTLNHWVKYVRDFASRTTSFEDAVVKLNKRFRDHDLGYEFVDDGELGVIIRKDSEYIHAEIVEPAIAGLYAAGFEGPLYEFMDAHRHYRHGEFDDAMNDALKAFESTMKAICDKQGWERKKGDTAQPLVNTLLTNELVPEYLRNYWSGITKVLEAGVPVLRNKESAHGDGPDRVEVPEHIVAFTLHLTASNIVFLLAADNALDAPS